MHFSRFRGSLVVAFALVPACTTPMVGSSPDASARDTGVHSDALLDTGPSCPAGQVDLDHNAANGCEYACTMTSSTDEPDSTFADANCDGIDGVVATGVFVSPSGVDTNPGTMAMPVLTIAHALMLAHTQHGDVYVDRGTYAESLTLIDGVGVYGGFDRTVSRTGSIAGYWDRRADATTTIMGGPTAIEATGIAMGAVLDRLTIHAADATDPGHSSIAVWAHGSTGMLRVSASTLVAGAGAAGVAGVAGMLGMNGGNGAVGGAPGTSPCMGPAGGMGGTGGSPGGGVGMMGAAGGSFAGPPVVPGGMGGTPGIPGGGACFGGGGISAGGLGQSGNVGAPGMTGTAGTGTGSAGAGGAWVPGDGSAGANGAPGTGGGGGGGGAGSGAGCITPAVGGPGGGGGAGGCGGEGGHGGGGGGGSFGVLAIDAIVVVSNDDVTTGVGGNGANGGSGGGSGGPGAGGPGVSTGNAGRGGDGGRGAPGGRGGNGGAGGGGPSICLAHGGTGSIMNSGSVLHPGTGGHAATVPSMATDGVAEAMHEL